MQHWLSANEWVFGLMGGLLLFFLARWFEDYRAKQQGQDESIKTLGDKLDEVNLNLSEIKYSLRERPDTAAVEQIVSREIVTHIAGCPAREPRILREGEAHA